MGEQRLTRRPCHGWSAQDPCGQKWFDYVNDMAPITEWRYALKALSYVARKDPEAKIVLAAEVQIIFKPYMDGRALSHLLFKISRCETGVYEMSRDFSGGLTFKTSDMKEREKAVARIAMEVADAKKGKGR